MSNDQFVLDRPKLNVPVQTSGYDRLNGMLQAVMMLVGFLVLMMFLVWLTSNFKFSRSASPIDITELEGEEGELDPLGVGDDAFEPGVEEFPDVEVPQLMDALEAVTTAASTVKANSEMRDGDAAEMGKGRGLGNKDGGGGGGGGVIPEYKRWRIEYESSSLDVYVRQLSFFQIDIGSVEKDGHGIKRLRDPAGNRQVIDSNRETETKAKSLYFGHEKRKLQQWDERILKGAGVPFDNCLVVQFYPQEVRAILRAVEKDYLAQKNRKLKEVKNTFFKIVESNGAFQFQITDQIYR